MGVLTDYLSFKYYDGFGLFLGVLSDYLSLLYYDCSWTVLGLFSYTFLWLLLSEGFGHLRRYVSEVFDVVLCKWVYGDYLSINFIGDHLGAGLVKLRGH